MEELLKKAGLTYEDLNPGERETLNVWMDALQKNQITVDSIRGYISSMRDAVEAELSRSDNGTKQDIFLKARLRNYLLLASFMSTPEKAKQSMENVLSGLVRKVK